MKFFAVFFALVAMSAARGVLTPETWTLHELSNAIMDPNTDPALLPFLEHALNVFMDNLFAGNDIQTIPVVTPTGVVPAPGSVAPVVPEPVLEPIVPTPVAPAADSSAPLVQLIINVNAKKQEVIVPTPVLEPIETPVDPVIVVDTVEEPVVAPVIIPEPVVIAPVIVPEPVVVVPVNPEVNPIDVIAVAAPDVNPVDLISPVPVPVAGATDGIIV